jgi:hypothetical protein
MSYRPLDIPLFASDPYEGTSSTPQSDRLGTVAYDQHPEYKNLPQRLADLAVKLGVKEIKVRIGRSPAQGNTADKTRYEFADYSNDSARAVVRKIVTAVGNITQIELWVVPGMQYTTLEHELRHLEQVIHLSTPRDSLANTQYNTPLRFSEVWRRNPEGGVQRVQNDRNIDGGEGAFQRNEADILEAHNCLVDFKHCFEVWEPGDEWSEIKDLSKKAMNQLFARNELLRNWKESEHSGNTWFTEYFNNPENPPPGGTWDTLVEILMRFEELDEAGFIALKQQVAGNNSAAQP